MKKETNYTVENVFDGEKDIKQTFIELIFKTELKNKEDSSQKNDEEN